MKLSEDFPAQAGDTPNQAVDETLTRLTLALDVIGGDFGPTVTVPVSIARH